MYSPKPCSKTVTELNFSRSFSSSTGYVIIVMKETKHEQNEDLVK